MSTSKDIATIRELKARIEKLEAQVAEEKATFVRMETAWRKECDMERHDKHKLEAALQYFYDYGYDRGMCEAALKQEEKT